MGHLSRRTRQICQIYEEKKITTTLLKLTESTIKNVCNNVVTLSDNFYGAYAQSDAPKLSAQKVPKWPAVIFFYAETLKNRFLDPNT